MLLESPSAFSKGPAPANAKGQAGKREGAIKMTLARILIAAAGLLVAALLMLRVAVLPYYDGKLNAVAPRQFASIDGAVKRFHQQSFVAHMHADSLLWGRDLASRHTRGQADLPRLREGGVDLQVFSVVTQVPYGLNYTSNPSKPDLLPILFIASWRHPQTWFSPRGRALAQAAELTRLGETGQLQLVLRRDDLASNGFKALLALEGMHALERGAADLIELHAAGYRMMGLAHFFDNAIAGSAHGIEKYGLTGLGRRLIPHLERLGITLDLAHASPAAFAETLALAKKPVVVSHAGVRGTCPGPRNLSDEQLRALARNGGIVGIGYWKEAVCDASLDGITRALLHAVNIAGIDHVGLGSDFDGAIGAPFDASGLVQLTAALFDAGLSASDIGKLLGGNLRRVLEINLPQ